MAEFADVVLTKLQVDTLVDGNKGLLEAIEILQLYHAAVERVLIDKAETTEIKSLLNSIKIYVHECNNLLSDSGYGRDKLKV